MDIFLSSVQKRFRLTNTNEESCWLQTLFKVVKDNFDKSGEGVCLDIVQALVARNMGMLPIGHKVISVSDLTKPQYNSIAFTASPTTTTSQLKDSNWLEEKSLILIGRLTTEPKSKKVLTSGNGVLYLEDSSHAIICEVTKVRKEWLDKIVVLCHWNFISCATFPILIFEDDICQAKDKKEQRRTPFTYIEVLGDCIYLNDNNVHGSAIIPKSIPVEQYQEGSLNKFNLKGRIKATSPLFWFQSKDAKPFFLIQLESVKEHYSVVIIFKGKQYCGWYNFMTVGEEFVFSNLKETKMNKGRPSERNVIAASSTSDFFKIVESEPEEMLVPPEKKRKVAEIGGAGLNPMVESSACSSGGNTSGTIKTSMSERPHSLCCTKPMAYQGVITAIVDIAVGTYEIDHKFKLYTYLQPRSNFGCGWRVGASVSLHNVHMCKLEKDILGFCCCFVSSVQITQFSKLATPFEPVIPARDYLYTHIRRMSLIQFLQLFDLIEVLCRKFQPVLRRQSIVPNKMSANQNSSTILSHVVDLESLSTIPLPDVYTDFFETPHKCLVSNPAHEFRVPVAPTLKDLRDFVEGLDTREGCSGIVGDSMYEWSYKDVTQDLPDKTVIVGYLKARSRTGQLVLCDRTAKIRCLITQTDISDQHHCNSRTCINTRPSNDGIMPVSDLKRNTCPFVNLAHNGAILKIRKFKIVVENFRGRILQGGTNKQDIRKYYLIFSLCDADVIGWIPEKSTKDNQIVSKIERKFVLLLRNKELIGLNLQKRILTSKTCLDVCFLGEVSNEGPSFQLDYKKKSAVISIFDDCSSPAYLKPGGLYYVTELCDVGGVSRVHNLLASQSGQTYLEWTGAMKFEHVDMALYETDIFEQIKEYTEESRDISTIKDALVAGVESKCGTNATYGASKTLYSLRGRILHRDIVFSGSTENLCSNGDEDYLDVPHFGKIEHSQAENFNLGYYFLRSRSVVLTLGDNESADQVKVYCNLTTFVYPFGLLPGACVLLAKLSRHVAKSGNIYFKFLPCSDVTVESVLESGIQPKAPASLQVATQRDIVDFSNAVLAGGLVPTVCYILGYITAVQKVHLKWSCSKCGKLVKDCYCVDVNKSSVFTAEARVIIEDGSCEAMLFIKGDNVKILLATSNKVWDEITNPKYGEVYYQKASWKAASTVDPNDNRANKLLYEHMRSTTPLRLVKVLCKQFKMASRRARDQAFESCDIFVNGEPYSTFIRDKVTLNCLELSNVNYLNEAKQLLQSL